MTLQKVRPLPGPAKIIRTHVGHSTLEHELAADVSKLAWSQRQSAVLAAQPEFWARSSAQPNALDTEQLWLNGAPRRHRGTK